MKLLQHSEVDWLTQRTHYTPLTLPLPLALTITINITIDITINITIAITQWGGLADPEDPLHGWGGSDPSCRYPLSYPLSNWPTLLWTKTATLQLLCILWFQLVWFLSSWEFLPAGFIRDFPEGGILRSHFEVFFLSGKAGSQMANLVFRSSSIS